MQFAQSENLLYKYSLWKFPQIDKAEKEKSGSTLRAGGEECIPHGTELKIQTKNGSASFRPKRHGNGLQISWHFWASSWPKHYVWASRILEFFAFSKYALELFPERHVLAAASIIAVGAFVQPMELLLQRNSFIYTWKTLTTISREFPTLEVILI